ncbi:MAG TPA: nitroreductase family protein [Clostridia bacterium]|nr:nitroreductase family protein [Clostridia bacterium]
MTFLGIIKERKPIEEYEKRKLSLDEIKIFEEFLEEIEVLRKNIGIKFVFIEDGWGKEEILRERVSYMGNLVLAPNYVALLSEVKEGYLSNAAYILEQIMLKAVDLNIGSCWIFVEEDADGLKMDLGVDAHGELIAMIALGYPKTHIHHTDKSEDLHINIDDFVFKNEWGKTICHEELKTTGMGEALNGLRLTPSWVNPRPWKLIIHNDQIILTVGGKDIDEKYLLIDAGIMMLYMENAFKEAGLPARWSIYREELDGDFSEYNIPSEYQIIGTLHI